MSSLNEYLRFVVTLTAVVDPFLAVPFFLALAAERSFAERVRLARVVALTVFTVLAVSVFVGEALLDDLLHSYLLHVTAVSPERFAERFVRILQPLDPTDMISTAQRLRAERKAEGKAEGKVELLLRLLVAKFGKLPEAATRRVRTAAEPQLDAFGLRLLTASTLDDVFCEER